MIVGVLGIGLGFATILGCWEVVLDVRSKRVGDVLSGEGGGEG